MEDTASGTNDCDNPEAIFNDAVETASAKMSRVEELLSDCGDELSPEVRRALVVELTEARDAFQLALARIGEKEESI